ncbi:MAG: hypothetical protein GY696_16900 [Gammaproteobacteria bacterium]|nr:hypothetical protein [Gammaproteobacteria bacterium]
MHPEADLDGLRFALKEALIEEAAVAAQSVTKDSRVLTVEQMLAELDKIFQPKTESAMAQREFKDYLQHLEEPAMMYFSAKRAFLEKAFPESGNIRDLLEATRTGLASRYVRQELIKDSHMFKTFEELRDSALTHISTQKASFLEGLAADTSMDGLAVTNPYAQPQKHMVAQTPGTHSVQPAAVLTQWPPPGPARAQNQWGAPAPARAPNQLGPGRPYTVQAMPAATFLCHNCGQAGHLTRKCPHISAPNGCGGAGPAGPSRGRGIYQFRGGYSQYRGGDKSRMVCYRCLGKGHTVHGCTVTDQQAEAMRQDNLKGIMAARGAPAVSAVLEGHYEPTAGNFMGAVADMPAAFESLNQAGSGFQ